MPVRDPEKLLQLTPSVFHILLALADSGRHGYGIIKEVLGEIKFLGGDEAELKLSAPHKAEPMILKLVRE